MASRLKDDSLMNKNDDNEDLLIFGYSCKLFRDDEKALFIDQGKHLIPWMGDDTLKIDRYDARGTLYDLKHVEAPSGGFDRFFGLTDMERQVETMCDEERYRALMTNEEEESMYQEEELKRLHYAINDQGKSYGQVEYKYEGEKGETNNTEEQAEKTSAKSDDGADDEPFVPSPQLDIPLNMVLPETVKHNAIIEKTAMFISSQGPQMEILLKMKQAGNPQFNFLSFDNPLHSYYRHLLMAIKGGRYKPDLQNNEKREIENDEEEDDHYLHPSLASSVSKVELAPSIPSINYKPSAHCAYSMLVNKIKDKKAKNNEQTNLNASNLTKLKQALERFKDNKKSEENGSGNESDSNGSTGSGKLKSSINNYSFKNNVQAFETPPNDMQIIIDKMASYVAKNGRDFEAVVQSKKDPRFDFLNAYHKYNPYYQHKIRQYENLDKPQAEAVKNIRTEESKTKDEQSKGKLAPVCFSIKKPKETEPVIEKSALPVEESSDEEGKEDKDGNTNEEKEREKEKEKAKDKEKEVKEDIVTVDLAAIEDKEEKNKKILATERLKDKLTAAAREKVAMATREKQLQMERKRRAAAFLKTLQSDAGSIKVAPLYGPQLPGGESVERVTDDDSDVASLPDAVGDEEKPAVEKSKKAEAKPKTSKFDEERLYRTSGSSVRHKHREKHRSTKPNRGDRTCEEESKSKDGNDRISESASSEEGDRRKVYFTEDFRKLDKRKNSEDIQYRSKCDKVRSLRKEEKRHKRKKHKRDDRDDRNHKRHSKSKKQKRNRDSEDERSSRSKRSRMESSNSSSNSSVERNS